MAPIQTKSVPIVKPKPAKEKPKSKSEPKANLITLKYNKL